MATNMRSVRIELCKVTTVQPVFNLLWWLLLLFCVLVVPPVEANSSPCPDYAKGTEYNCTSVRLPPGLCSSCSIGLYNASGDYLDCTRTSNLENSLPCLSAWEQYVQLNPCDLRRRNALKWYKSKDPAIKERGRQTLDYATYALCENGCDCIPQVTANPATRTMDVHRGNCQAHMWYDICKILPNIKWIQLLGINNSVTTADINTLPFVCPIVKKWISTRDGKSFRNVTNTTVDPAVQVFLNGLFQAQQILETDFWDQCYAMEGTQQRIAQAPFEPIRINAGELQSDYIDTMGQLWKTDRYYSTATAMSSSSSSSSVYQTTGDIQGTDDDTLYLSERRANNTTSNSSLTYSIPVPNGQYRVTLGFSEIVYQSQGQRVFDVSVQGESLFSAFDIVKVTGSPFTAIDLFQVVNATHGTVSVELDPIVADPKISFVSVELNV